MKCFEDTRMIRVPKGGSLEPWFLAVEPGARSFLRLEPGSFLAVEPGALKIAAMEPWSSAFLRPGALEP